MSQREMVYLGNNRALTRTIFGHKMFVSTKDVSLTPHILLDGLWEPHISKVFVQVVRDGMTVVEIGANIGYYTLIAASMVGERGRVITFEPDPDNFELLFRNVEINGFMGRVTTEKKAVFDRTGTLRFSRYKYHQGSNTVGEVAKVHLDQWRDEVEVIEVEAVSLDEYLPGNTKVDLIKMDAEGAEPFIFAGMMNIVRNNPNIAIFCEFAPALVSGVGKDPRFFLEELQNEGFKLRYIDADSKVVNISVENLLEMPHSELFLTR
ncbi:MAG: FkbM family methyltransferase [Bacillota bacterium]